MPTETFFRLPEEKRMRILNAAWEEFTRVSYVDVSINRIVQRASIPRGSFYQYFEGKEELFDFLIGRSRSELIDLLRSELERAQGDPFAMTEGAFERLFGVRETARPEEFLRIFDLLRLNASIDMPRVFLNPPKGPEDLCLNPPKGPEDLCLNLMEHIDLRLLKTGSAEYVEAMLSLLISSFGAAVVGTLLDPTQYQTAKVRLRRHIEIIKSGAAAHEGGTDI